MSNKKVKIQVSMTEDMVNRLDEICKTYGVSRSQWCAMMLGQQIVTSEKLNKSITPDLLKDVLKEGMSA